MNKFCIKIDQKDNVAVLIKDVEKGVNVIDDVISNEKILQSHKIALKDIYKNEEIIRYGVVLGYANKDIKKGDLVNENMLDLPDVPNLENLKYGVKIEKELPKPTRDYWYLNHLKI